MGRAPENSEASFRLACEMGVDGCETDVRFTKDKQIVISHDEVLLRQAGVNGLISDYTLEELLTFDFGRDQPGNYGPQRLLTLSELLNMAKACDLYLNIEVKHSSKAFFHYEALPLAAAQMVEDHGMAERVLFSSFLHPYMLRIKRRFPHIACGLLYEKSRPARVAYTKLLGMEAMHPRLDLITADLVSQAHRQGLAVHAWTVNTAEDIDRMLDCGVDAIIGNFPDLALELARQRGAHE